MKTLEQTAQAVKTLAAKLAAKQNLETRTVRQSTFWADNGAEIITWTNADGSERIEYRTRFGNPVLEWKDGHDMACVDVARGSRPTEEKDKYGYNIYEYDNCYRPREFQAWGANGLVMLKYLVSRLERVTHKASNDFITEG